MLKTKSRLRVWYSGLLCCRTERKLSIRQYLTQEPSLMNILGAAGLRSALCDDIHYLEWVTHCRASFSRLTSRSWSRSQSRYRTGEMPESGWGPAVAAVCPLVRGLTRHIMKHSRLMRCSSPVWRRRGRLRQGNTGLMLLHSEPKDFLWYG